MPRRLAASEGFRKRSEALTSSPRSMPARSLYRGGPRGRINSRRSIAKGAVQHEHADRRERDRELTGVRGAEEEAIRRVVGLFPVLVAERREMAREVRALVG